MELLTNILGLVIAGAFVAFAIYAAASVAMVAYLICTWTTRRDP